MPFHRRLSPPKHITALPRAKHYQQKPEKKFEKSVGNCGDFRTFEPKIEKTSI